MTDKIKAIAEYDGWKLTGRLNSKGYEYFDHSEFGTRPFNPFSHLYNKNLNLLHPVAMKVLGELRQIEKPGRYLGKSDMLLSQIAHNCALEPNEQGEYDHLLDAVYNGVVFINQYKKNQK